MGHRDLISARRSVQHSGLRVATYRVMSNDAELASEHIEQLRARDCGIERFSERYFAVDVPPEVDIREVYALLDERRLVGGLTFDEAHYGRQTT